MKIWIKYNRKQLLVQSIVFVIIMFYFAILWHNVEAVLNLRHFLFLSTSLATTPDVQDLLMKAAALSNIWTKARMYPIKHPMNV